MHDYMNFHGLGEILPTYIITIEIIRIMVIGCKITGTTWILL